MNAFLVGNGHLYKFLKIYMHVSFWYKEAYSSVCRAPYQKFRGPGFESQSSPDHHYFFHPISFETERLTPARGKNQGCLSSAC